MLPTHLVSSDRLDDVMIMFSDMDIEIDNQAKQDLLGVPAEILQAHGAVSEATARAMVEGALIHSQAQVALVIQGHTLGLAQRVLAVEHPAVGAGKQGVSDVADARLHRRARPGGGTGALDPLPL